MTQDEIIVMAKLVGFHQTGHLSYQVFTATIQDFAKLVAEREREACVKVADEYANGLERNYSKIIADEIRARRQA